MLHRLAWVSLALALVGSGCCGGPDVGPGSDAGTRDGAARDAAASDAAELDAAPDDDGGPPVDAALDAGERCAACAGSVVTAMRGGGGVPGFSAECPAGEVVDFAGTQRWVGPGSDLITNACATEGDFEPTFYVCCEPAAADAGTDAGGSLASGDVCDPSGSLCGDGLACCYPCGIPDCDYRCEPRCDPSDSSCFDGCMLRP